MNAPEAAAVIRGSLKNPEKPVTVADAATASGLALRDAERGLQWLSHEYRGHLRVTEDGDLLFLFPTGFSKPWVVKEGLGHALGAAWRVVAGVGRFVVRAWLMVVLVGYAAIFLAILIASTFSGGGRSSNNSSSRGGGALAFVLFRVLADAMFWTFHPFSPLAVGNVGNAYGQINRGASVRRARDETPFYERVNRFFFGPTEPREDERASERRVLQEIRKNKGRVGVSDVMRVTGLPREQADPMMARLMLDYDGEVEVSESGAIFYTFAALRKTALEGAATNAADATGASAGAAPKKVPPLTGNSVGTNVAIAALNGFNAIMAWFAIGANLTVHKTLLLFAGARLIRLPYDGVPIVLGVIPLVFSLALFLLPLARAAIRPLRARRVRVENARLSVLREVLSSVRQHRVVTDEALRRVWTGAAGTEPSSKELTREVVRLGGDVDLEAVEATDTGARYRFADLEAEEEALEAERATAAEEEAKVGKVIFASDQ